MLLDLDYRQEEIDGLPGVRVEMRPPSMEAFQRLLRLLGPYVQGAGDEEGAVPEDQALKLVASEELRETAEAVLPAHIGQITGLSIRENGQTRPATVEDIVAHGAMARIALMLLMRLIALGRLSEEDQGNSATPRPAGSAAAPPAIPGNGSPDAPPSNG